LYSINPERPKVWNFPSKQPNFLTKFRCLHGNQAWQLYEESKLIDLLDPTISWCNGSIEKAICVVEMALLCTHSRAPLRPTMTSVVSMLTGGSEVVIPKLSRFDARDYADLGFKFSDSGNNSAQETLNLQTSTSHNSITDSSNVSILEPR